MVIAKVAAAYFLKNTLNVVYSFNKKQTRSVRGGFCFFVEH
ncbi:hypothetical protein Barb6_02360 [Bacteroidales bacterium Barb6]|nr:hypothetical protein Barb6_02360 [Bacteroidales bacterium Barb6]